MSKRQDIKGYNSDHPDWSAITKEDYEPIAPVGEWLGRLDALAWGKSANLFCFFTHLESGKGYRLCVFHSKKYQPAEGDVYFDCAPIGGLYNITTKESRNGLARFMKAELQS